MCDKRAVEPGEPVALVQIGKVEPVLQGEFGHRRLLREEAAGNHRQIAATAMPPQSKLQMGVARSDEKWLSTNEDTRQVRTRKPAALIVSVRRSPGPHR